VSTQALGPDRVTHPGDVETTRHWSLVRLFTFRAWFLYVGAYVAVTQILATMFPIPGLDVPDPGTLPPVRPAVVWVAKHVFAVTADPVVTGSGSGDKIFDWTEMVVLLAAAVVAAAIWSVLARRRRAHDALERWLRLTLRVALGSTFIMYGLVKVIPLQMPPPLLPRLVEPYGNLSPMGVLWTFIGSSLPYEMLVGAFETAAGILILIPSTALLGTLLCLWASAQIFTLNMAYDVPVKLLSFHLVVFSAFLLLPDARRLWSFLVLDRGAPPPDRPRLLTRRRLAAALPALYVAYLLGVNVYSEAKRWREFGGGAARSPLFGVWEVVEMTADGAPRPPIVSDRERWRRVLFEFPQSVAFQRMDDSFARYRATLSVGDRRLELSSSEDEKWAGAFLVDRPSPDRLVLDGDMDHHRMHLMLRLVDHTKFQLNSRGFHWVQEYPFNR
jgi:uncharacterized membrane protein YphA (DoxX/SURF4 family)